ncbi:fructose PTS transporter subunit IIA [Leptotrichia massiliensis]|mgnify:CR=1 FL=1|uniref:PTS sugar transporter subunit IIA n=1 Tax=Leptotrichia massiliensis TaxID=1852388 RepID=UPI0028D76AE3|nr:fructose PTS transporter subunit IIA [Leptotrichia massiliensis]
MEVRDILDLNTIRVGIDAKNKNEVIEELASLLLENGYISDMDSYVKDIYEREKLGQTGIGNFIAVPHGRSDSVQKVGVAIGITKQEIEWETIDEHGVKVIILFSVGTDTKGAETHLKILTMFARKLGNDEVVEKLINAKTSQEVVKAFS